MRVSILDVPGTPYYSLPVWGNNGKNRRWPIPFKLGSKMSFGCVYLTVHFVFNFVKFTLSYGSKTAIFAVNFGYYSSTDQRRK